MKVNVIRDGRTVVSLEDTNEVKNRIAEVLFEQTAPSQDWSVKEYLEKNISPNRLRFVPFRRKGMPLEQIGAVYNIESDLRWKSPKRNPDDIYDGAYVCIGPYIGGEVDVRTILEDRVATPEDLLEYMKTLRPLLHQSV